MLVSVLPNTSSFWKHVSDVKAYMERMVASMREKERMFCNVTVPEDNWYWIVC